MEIDAMPVPMLVDVVNGWGTVPRARADDRERAAIADLLDRHAVPPELAASCTDRVLERIADELYAVFAASGGRERARLVNALLTKSGVRPALACAGSRIRPTWLVPRERDALLAAAAVALRHRLAEHDAERLGTCASIRCGDVFVDVSPGAHRRFCSVTCQNRERVAAFGRRKAHQRLLEP